MHQEAAILDAKGIVRFNDNEEFASALAITQNRPLVVT